MEKPILDFLVYLIRKCIKNCKVDPANTTVEEFLVIISEEGSPVGF